MSVANWSKGPYQFQPPLGIMFGKRSEPARPTYGVNPVTDGAYRMDVQLAQAGRPMSAALPVVPATTTTTTTVAVVDDDENVRVGIGNLIRAIGFRPELFEGGPAFLHQDVSRFACVLSDMQMPVMSGLELQRELAARAPDLPIIFITGYPDEGIKEAAFAAGAKGFFEKPFDIGELVAVVEGIVGTADA